MESSTAKKLIPSMAPRIYDYHDYRDFLRDWVQFEKADTYGFSLRKLSLSAGFSHSFLSHVLNEIRFLSVETATQLVPHLNLAKDENKYFLSLVEVNEADDESLRRKAIKKIQKIRVKLGLDPVALETYEYLNAWYYVAIRELAFSENFVADPDWIKTQLHYPVSKTKIAKAVRFLIEKDFLKEQADGSFRPSEKLVSARGGVFQLMLGDFHKEMLDINKLAIDQVAKEERKQIGFILNLDEKNFTEAREILEAAKNKIAALEEKSQGEKKVYHVNLSSFPLAGGKS